MDVLIPLYATCRHIQKCDSTRMRVLTDMPVNGDDGELYLNLDTITHADVLDLKMDKHGATVLLAPAFHHAYRETDEDMPRVNAEDYTRRGAEIARSLHFGSPIEYLAAWMNEDRKQAEWMRALDAVLSLNVITKLPQWMRHDLMMILESETMKQIFAKRFFDELKVQPMDHPLDRALKSDLRLNADNTTNPIVSELMSQTMQSPITYNGCAREFYEGAEDRMTAFRNITIG